MSDFTIEQLEALKEGTKNAPWRPEYDEGDEHWVIAFDHPKFGGRWDVGIAHGEDTANAFAAAPALVDALIAEKRAHQRLRDEMGELVEYLSIQEGNDRPSRFYVHGQHSAMELIKDILEADNG